MRSRNLGGAQWWVRCQDGHRLRLGESPLVVGRAVGCHILVSDPRVSGRHALLWLTMDGPELVVVGRHPMSVDGETVTRATALRDGARLVLGGAELVVERTGRQGESLSVWAFETPRGDILSPRLPSLTLGGGLGDTVFVPGWPPAALGCEIFGSSLLLQPTVACRLDDEELGPGEIATARNGSCLVVGTTGLRLLRQTRGSLEATVPQEPASELAERVQFTFLPRGARLHLQFRDGTADLWLSELRSALVGALLGASTLFPPGAQVPDDDLVRLIWPNRFDRSNVHLNQVVHRCREALVEVGIDPFRVLSRPKGAGYTRFCLGPQTRVELL